MWKRLAAGLLIAAVLFGWILRRVESDLVVTALGQARWLLLPPVLLLLGASVFLKAQRWSLAIGAGTGERPRRRVFSATMIGTAANSVLPARLGDWLRAMVLHKHNRVSTTHALVASWGAQAFDLFAVAVLLLAGVAAGKGVAPARVLVVLVAGVLGMIAILGALSRRPQIVTSWAGRLPFGLGERASTLAEHATEGLRFLGAPSVLARVLSYTVAVWAVEVGAMWLALYCFHIATSVAAAGLLVAAIGLSFVVPLTPGNVGTYQVIAILVLGQFGVDADRAFAFGIGYQGLALVATLALGMTLFLREGLSLTASEISAVAAEADGRNSKGGVENSEASC